MNPDVCSYHESNKWCTSLWIEYVQMQLGHNGVLFQKGALVGQKAALNLIILNVLQAKYDRPSNAREQFMRIWPGIEVPKI